jgi:methionine synthase II (cobalamin-independent)
LGFDIFTDGEFRRRNFMSDFTDAVEGFDLGDAVARSWKAGQSKDAPVSSVTGIVVKKLRAVEPLTGRELSFLKKTQPRRHQNDPAERHTISGDFIQARRH